MARITGKNAKIQAEATRTSISVAVALTDGGAHTVYTYTGHPLWDPATPPVITKQTHGSGSFVVQDPSLYTVDYIAGTVTFLVALNSDDVVKANTFDYVTVADVADVFDWAIDAKIDTVDVTAFQDTYHTKLSAFRGWSATAASYHRSDFWFPLWTASKPCYVKFFPDGGGSEYFIGAGFVDFGEKAPMAGAVADSVKIEGIGAFQRSA